MIFLLLATSPDALPAHLAALSRELLDEPMVCEAIEACAAYQRHSTYPLRYVFILLFKLESYIKMHECIVFHFISFYFILFQYIS